PLVKLAPCRPSSTRNPRPLTASLGGRGAAKAAASSRLLFDRPREAARQGLRGGAPPPGVAGPERSPPSIPMTANSWPLGQRTFPFDASRSDALKCAPHSG